MGYDTGRPAWSVDGRDWPNREHSRLVPAGNLMWHVQEMGGGPRLLMLHGTGAATHSFRDLAPSLARNFHLLMPDLAGHGFTSMPPNSGLSLAGMARLTGALLAQTAFVPDIAVGHSAGAAILIEMALAGMIRPKLIVAVNGALLPSRGAALFSPLAKLLFVNPLAPKLFALRAHNRDATVRLLEGTGSHIEARGIDLYQRLFRKSGHVAATLGMMANWDLEGLQRRIPALSIPLVLISAPNDRAVPPGDAGIVARRVKGARVLALTSGGHLVHEEQPERIAEIIVNLARVASILPERETEHLSK
jgi:magnesium chelatase accessory protein